MNSNTTVVPASLQPVMTKPQRSGVNLMDAFRQWRSRPADQRFQTLGALMEALNNRRLKSRSEVVSLPSLTVEPNETQNTLHLVSPGAMMDTTHWSFGQLCQRIGAPAGYMRDLPVALAADNLNYSMKKAEAKKVRLLTVVDDHGAMLADNLQAVTSETYGRIWDYDVVQAVQRIVDRSGGKFFNPKEWDGTPGGLYASDHDVFCFMIDGGSWVDGGGDRDQLHRGFFIWNSETGAKSFGIKTFLHRGVCGNHIVYDADEVCQLIIRHSLNAPGRFDREALPKLIDYVNASSKPLEDKIRKAKAYALPMEDGEKGADALIPFGLKTGFTRPEIRGAYAAAVEEEGQCAHLWDFINGLTAYARGYEFIDSRVDLESRAGKLMEMVA